MENLSITVLAKTNAQPAVERVFGGMKLNFEQKKKVSNSRTVLWMLWVEKSAHRVEEVEGEKWWMKRMEVGETG